jgi:hypothetical protein
MAKKLFIAVSAILLSGSAVMAAAADTPNANAAIRAVPATHVAGTHGATRATPAKPGNPKADAQVTAHRKTH